MSLIVFFLPILFLLQGLMGYTALDAGLRLLPSSAIIAILTPVAGTWPDKHGAKHVSLLGLIRVTASMYYFSTLTANSSLFHITTSMIIRSVGLGLLLSPLSSALLNAVSPGKTVIASYLYGLFMQIGGSISTSIFRVIHRLLIALSIDGHWRYSLMAGLNVCKADVPCSKKPATASKEHALS